MAEVIGSRSTDVVIATTPATTDVVLVEQADRGEVLFVEYAAGPKGDPAPNVELRTTTDYLQWRLVGETEWKNLIGLDALVARGAAPSLVPGTVTSLPWTQPATAELLEVSAGAYQLNLGLPAGAPGADGQPRFWGQGMPPTTIPGSRQGDLYLDTDTGTFYRLT